MTKRAVVLLASGFEEIEAVTVIDVLRRAGVAVQVAGVGVAPSGNAIGAHDLVVGTDCLLEDLNDHELDMVVLPGGLPGATNLAASEEVRLLVRAVLEHGGMAAAICAAPLALDAAGVLAGAEYTCYPSIEKQIRQGKYTGARVQCSGRLITGCGPGASLEFALALVEGLGLAAKAAQLRQGMLAG